MPYDYERYLQPKLKSLYFEDERYSGLRKLIESDKELIFAVRKKEIHIYYLGGRILKIKTFYNDLKFSFDLEYTKKQKGSKELNEYADTVMMLNNEENKCKVDLWIKHFGDLKRCMEYYRNNIKPEYERQLQQNIELANRDFNGEVIVVDNEYAVRKEYETGSKLCRVDLVALYKDSEEYKICLIELKLGDGAIDRTAGIADHINDYKNFLNIRRNDIIASVNNFIEYKKLNHFLVNVPDNIKLSEDTDICVSILCYDLPPEKKENALSFINGSREGVDFKLHYNLRLDSRCHRLSKEDILGEQI